MNSQVLKLLSFAKVNLFLRVLGKRADGFHEISTAFQTVSLFDEITFSEADEILLESDDPLLSVGESNLIFVAANILREFSGKTLGARIKIKKRIPFPGGLGGGSSNAAIALLGLATLWKLDISFEKLIEFGSQVGSDVPFFFYGGTALGKGRGTNIFPVSDHNENHLVIVTPNIEISTSNAYSKLDAEDLTNTDPKSILKNCRDGARKLESGHLNFRNDFENSVFRIEPKIKQIKQRLLDSGAKAALLSGSGASVFAIFDNEEIQQVAFKKFESNNEFRKFAVKTISRREYRDALEPCKHLLPKSF